MPRRPDSAAARRRTQPSTHPGMGATAHDDGVTFRVWAPNARNVAVIGDFCGWDSARKVPLAKDSAASGTWSAFVPEAGPGSEYRFLVRRGGPYLWRVDPCARQLTHTGGNAVVLHPRSLGYDGHHFTAPGWEDLVLYEIHVPTFAAEGGDAGTFDRAVRRLDHLAWLGVSAVAVMPPFPFATETSWGYNPCQLSAIEPRYGGPHAFARFVRAAHARGIAVILDVVHNHLGPTGLDLWRFEGGGSRRYGGPYFYNDRRALTPWGATRPNYGKKEVRNFLRDSAVVWLEEFQVDGLRFDAVNYIRARWGDVRDPGARIAAGERFLAAMTADLRSRQPWKILIAEDMQSDPAVTRPSAQGGLGFHSQWDAGFVHPVRSALEALHDHERDVAAVAAAVAGAGGVAGYGPQSAYGRVVFTESHDEVANGKARVPETISPGAADSWHARKRAALGLVLVLTSPGIPMLFQGQDFLEDGWFDDRRPLDWAKTHTRAGFLHLVRDLIHLRRNASGTTAGLSGAHVRILRADQERKVLAYHRARRGGPGDDTIVAVNLSTNPVTHYAVGVPAPGRWRIRCNTDSPDYAQDFGAVHSADPEASAGACDGLPYHVALTLGPYSALVLSQDGPL